MNLLKIFIAAFSATNIMTTFSYLLSTNYKKLFKEPVMMNFILEGIGIHLKAKGILSEAGLPTILLALHW